MTYDVGQMVRLDLEIRDTGGALVDATVAVTVTNPSGSTASPGVAHDGLGLYHADVTLVEEGVTRWVADISGAYIDVQDGAFYATPAGTDVAWEPTLRQVASHLPTRTVELGDVTGQPTGTFSSLTLPTALQVEGFIAEAVAWVASGAGPVVDPTLYDLATAAATLYAAARVEYAQSETDRDSARIGGLEEQAKAAWERLITANAAAGRFTIPEADASLPVFSYPDPVDWGDSLYL